MVMNLVGSVWISALKKSEFYHHPFITPPVPLPVPPSKKPSLSPPRTRLLMTSRQPHSSCGSTYQTFRTAKSSPPKKHGIQSRLISVQVSWQPFGPLLKVRLLVGPTGKIPRSTLRGVQGIRRSPKLCQGIVVWDALRIIDLYRLPVGFPLDEHEWLVDVCDKSVNMRSGMVRSKVPLQVCYMSLSNITKNKQKKNISNAKKILDVDEQAWLYLSVWWGGTFHPERGWKWW